MADETLEYTTPFQLTKTIRRDPYDAISPTNPELSAAGKVIIITGGGSGLGAAAAEVWARAGAEGIVVAGRRLANLEETVSKLQAINNGKTKTIAIQADLAKDAEVANLFAETLKTFGRSPDVVLANAGVLIEGKVGETSPDEWWDAMYFIKTQPDPESPRGTFMVTNSGLAGVIVPRVSAYAVSKLGAQRVVEYLHLEYPTLRSFTLLPGVAKTPMLAGQFLKFGLDHVDMTGMLALYLSTSRAEFLRGGLTSVNWDIEETEAHKEEILAGRLLDLKWVQILPAGGGRGFE
ncbi:hypothetical protein LTR84_010800 [Exophiala bonariae]|uniref:Ketoreductase domain-containing protein n=1 Tax=Exophiala bonariae TaxID=1690606 RepID=A0AAV9NHU6_9EURO|nr:hypothetical protein LTR84_010800 [Exophiala bonariae]